MLVSISVYMFMAKRIHVCEYVGMYVCLPVCLHLGMSFYVYFYAYYYACSCAFLMNMSTTQSIYMYMSLSIPRYLEPGSIHVSTSTCFSTSISLSICWTIYTCLSKYPVCTHV